VTFGSSCPHDPFESPRIAFVPWILARFVPSTRRGGLSGLLPHDLATDG